MTESFGMKKTKSIFEEYVGEYVIIYPQHASIFSGKLKEIKGEHIVLNPHQTGRYDLEKGLIRKLEESSALVRISDIVAIEPTTRETLEDSCEYSNKEVEKERKHKEELIEQQRNQFRKPDN